VSNLETHDLRVEHAHSPCYGEHPMLLWTLAGMQKHYASRAAGDAGNILNERNSVHSLRTVRAQADVLLFAVDAHGDCYMRYFPTPMDHREG